MEENSKHNNYYTRIERENEEIVGIESYANPDLTGVGGVYKDSYKDFIVKEIISDGKILEIKEDSSSLSFSEELKDKYTTFNLIKINKDSFDALRTISKALKIPFDLIRYSGLKDKCSISVQRASIKGNYINELRNLKIKDIFIRNITPTRKSVKLGSNWGNNFIISIRKIEKEYNSEEKIKQIIQRITRYGIPNYYGLQRFGTFRPNSHLLGRWLLEKEYKKVYDEFVLRTYSSESLEAQQFRRDLSEDGDLEKAYNAFSKGLIYERMMIRYLMKHTDNYEGAINILPPYIIKLLISSFQSYIYNKMVSLRIKEGISLLKPKEGDVISIFDEDGGNITQTKYIYGGFYDQYLIKAIDLNRAAIVVPLIGYDTKLKEFPLMKNLLNKVMEEENIDQKIFTSELINQYDFKGSLRPIILKPKGLEILEYTEDEMYPDTMKLKIEFSLQKGSYATILLRELIK